jgi:hypothetical protein
MQQDYYYALASIVMASARDNAQLRVTIYELARSKLRQKLRRQAAELGPSEGARQLQALEAAIEQIEADLEENRQPHSRANVPAPVVYPSVEIISPARHLPPLTEPRYEFTAVRTTRPAFSLIRSVLALVAAATLGAVTYVGIQHGLHSVSQSNGEADQNVLNSTIQISKPALFPVVPTPAAYGVYALTDGQLTELQPLPIRIPDAKVAISGNLSSPSTTKLPNGRVQFIVFSRDLVNNAPEKLVVRVVAQVMHASAIGNSEEAAKSGRMSWAVRGISYQMKIAPVRGNPAMILIHPADVDFSFPAGRYALALKSTAYDFSVDGPITDSAQCVERNDEATAPIYTECRKP